MQIIEVNTPELAKEFLEFQPRLYKNDPNYIRPWDHEIEEVFDSTKNKWAKDGEIIRWLLQVDGKTVGRIAAFTHPKLEKKKELTGGCGFFECVNNQDYADKLFDTAKAWLESKGKTMMEGPINFGEKDKWWGLLVEGFEPPLYGMNYNPPYYQELLENYGFKNYYNQLVYRYDLEHEIDEKYYKSYQRLLDADSTYSFRCGTKKDLDKYAEDFRIVYNEAWAKAHKGFKPMTSAQTKKIMKTMKPIMDEDALIYAYHGERPIGIFISIPNINEAIKHLNGKFGLWEKLKFMYHLKVRKSVSTMAGIIFGVVPEYQGKGIIAGMVVKGNEKLVKPNRYRFMEMMWIGDFNPKMVSVVEALGSISRSKTLTTYRYLFDRNAPFERHPIINKD